MLMNFKCKISTYTIRTENILVNKLRIIKIFLKKSFKLDD